jgi:hypothetical protein
MFLAEKLSPPVSQKNPIITADLDGQAVLWVPRRT